MKRIEYIFNSLHHYLILTLSYTSMQHDKPAFKQAFTYLYFLMLSADKIADLKELKLGNKIIKLENLDKNEVMKDLDILSSLPRDKVYEQGINYMKSITRENQLKCLGYINLMAKVEGSFDENERKLLVDLGEKELNISMAEIAKVEGKLEKALDHLDH